MNNLFDSYLLSPIFILVFGSLLLLLAETASKKVKTLLTSVTLVGAGLMQVVVFPFLNSGLTAFSGTIYVDALAGFLNLLMIIGVLLLVLASDEFLESEGVNAHTEYYSLLLMSLAGAMVFASSAEFITMFLGLETMSLALYALCGCSVKDSRSSESAIKYFILGSVASAILLFGMVLLYGCTGSTRVDQVMSVINHVIISKPLFLIALGMLLVGIAFKIALVPLHWWAPDVYQGAPSSVTAYMAAIVKTAAFGVVIRLVYVLFADFSGNIIGFIWLLSVLSMLFGNLLALRQRSIKRMLAYSSIAHAGYLFMALLAKPDAGIPAILFYLTVYTFMTVGAFSLVMAVCPADGKQADDITAFNGLAKRAPLLAFMMSMFMLGFAGIPPAMGGLLGKFYLFNAVIKSGYVGIAIIGVLSSAIGVYYYLRVLVAMYFISPETEEKLSIKASGYLAPVGACVLGMVLLGVFPAWLYTALKIVISRF